MKIIFALITGFFLFSCSAKKESTLVKHSSIFANVNELGLTRPAFIQKYGNPISKDLGKEGTKLVERLYYLEIIDRVIITTKFTFENDQLVEQSSAKMEYAEDKRLKELQDEIEKTRLQGFMNQMNH